MRDKEEFASRSKRHEDFNFEPTIEETRVNVKKKRKVKKKNKFLIILLLIFVALVIFISVMYPKITLVGSKEIKLTINSEYVESGVKAKVLGKDKTKSVKIKGKVNTKKKGTYTITYSIKNLFLESKVKRVVKVLDEGPVITLEGDKDFSICPKKKYEEVGFKANSVKGKDVLEDDLSSKVKTKVEKDVVTYQITDKNGVMFVTTRNLVREDKEAPEIRLNGNEHIYITLGNNFTEPGYTVVDNCDEGLDDKVVSDGSVDTSKLGDYDINYKVSDKTGNEATKTRKVTVQREIVKRSANLSCGKPGVIYLTFDDGPNNTTTTRILDSLKKYNVKATFFVTSTNGGSDSQIKREFDEGHLVALHTNSHEYSQVYRSSDAYYNDLNKISDRVEKITGKKSMIIRFPGGSSNTVSRRYSTGIMSMLAADVEAKGYTYVDWNVDSTDAETATKTSDLVYSRVTTQLSKSKGNVVLMHDIKTTTAGAIERIIEYGLNNGYTFDVLDSTVVCHHRTAN